MEASVGQHIFLSPSSLVAKGPKLNRSTTRGLEGQHCLKAFSGKNWGIDITNSVFSAEAVASWRKKLTFQQCRSAKAGRRSCRGVGRLTICSSSSRVCSSISNLCLSNSAVCSTDYAEDHTLDFNPLHTSEIGVDRLRTLKHFDASTPSRRSVLSASALFFASPSLLNHPSKAHAGSIVVSRVPSPETLELLDQASEAWGRGLDPTSPNRWAALAEACKLFDKLVAAEPERLEWREARGQLRVDSKKFNEALTDFNFVLEKNPSNFRGYSSRALAYEGLADWDKAVEDYTTALRLGKQATGFDEPYVLNSRGNAFASLGKWGDALCDYELSVKGFQAGRQLDGAIYSAANAALMQIQLGNEKEGLKELTTVARRAPGSIDMRAALAALYWSQGREREAESTWEFACENINAGQLYDGCAKYRDQDWLRRIRRWPPVMADRMQDFFQLRHKT